MVKAPYMIRSNEVMNYCDEQMQWKEVPLHLPVSMHIWGIKPTMTGKHITVVGYTHTKGRTSGCYQMPCQLMIYHHSPGQMQNVFSGKRFYQLLISSLPLFPTPVHHNYRWQK